MKTRNEQRHTCCLTGAVVLTAALGTSALITSSAMAGGANKDDTMGNIYSEQSPEYGGSDYSSIRPDGSETAGNVGSDANVTPETGIYGEDSRLYGGPDYSGVRPGSDGDNSDAASGQVTGTPETSIYGDDSRKYGGSDYSSLRPEGDAFTTMDTNGDGQLTRDEVSSNERLHGDWSDVDANNDMAVDRSEFSAFEMRTDK